MFQKRPGAKPKHSSGLGRIRRARALATLVAARELIARPYGWHKGSLFRTVRGRNGINVESVCMLGALRRADGPGEHDATRLLEDICAQETGYGNIPIFNDKKGTTKKQVLAVFDAAIAKLQAPE